MRCEDCLTVIEEYFDGELDAAASRTVSAHLSACADCAAALDALVFEHDAYMRYERDVEVTPALWQGVRAAIAHEGELETAKHHNVSHQSRTSRGGAAIASAVSALAALFRRPLYAYSLALLAVGLATGALWFSLSNAPGANSPDVALEAVTTPRSGNDDAAPEGRARAEQPFAETETRTGAIASAATGERDARDEAEGGASGVPTAELIRASERDGRIAAPRDEPRDERRNAALASALREPSAPFVGDDDDPAFLDAGHRETNGDLLALVQPARLVGDDDLVANSRLLDPEEKEVARHVERAQMLLRSFRNARAGAGGSVNIAYERRLSRRLLDENTNLKFEAEARGDKATVRVLDELEPFLLDIANMRDRPSREDVRSVRERISRKEIIAALHIY